MQLRILLGPAPSLHGLRSSQGRLVRSLPRYYGQSDFSIGLIVGYGLRLPDNVPATTDGDSDGDLPIPKQKASAHARVYDDAGQHASCDIDTGCVAFCWTENISAPDLPYAAQYLACAFPCERFTSALADIRASLGAGAVRYSFTVTDFHRLPLAGLPAHPSTPSAKGRYDAFAKPSANDRSLRKPDPPVVSEQDVVATSARPRADEDVADRSLERLGG